MSLRKKMARGILWILVEKAGQQILTLAIFVVLARLIGPEEFGLAGLTAFFSVLATIVFFGLAEGIISQQITDDSKLSTLFWAVLVIGLTLSGLVYVGAPLFGKLMRDDRLIGLTQYMALLPVLCALATIPDALIRARMEFRFFAIRSLMAAIAGGIVGIVIAIRGGGAYALVGQQVVQNLVINLVVWPSARWVPRAQYDYRELKLILSPGVKLVGSFFIGFLESQIPRIAIAAALGPVQLGYYVLATRIIQALHQVLFIPLVVVLFPALAKIGDQPEKVSRIVRLSVFFIVYIMLPAAVGMAAISPVLIPLFFGEKWEPTVPVLQIYALFIIPGSMVLVIREVLRAKNRLGSFLSIQSAMVILLLIAVFVLVHQGLVVMTSGMVVIGLTTMLLGIRAMVKVGKVRISVDLIGIVVPAIACVTLFFSVNFYLHRVTEINPTLGKLAVSILLGGIVFAAICGSICFRLIASLVLEFWSALRPGKLKANE